MKKDMKGIKQKCWEIGLHRSELKYAKMNKVCVDLFCVVLRNML